uniref:Secreted protein n=1 Tax=Cacopsylla melanoneura TaxID=428564 RepID=A0A8D8Q3S0_9HEMI
MTIKQNMFTYFLLSCQIYLLSLICKTCTYSLCEPSISEIRILVWLAPIGQMGLRLPKGKVVATPVLEYSTYFTLVLKSYPLVLSSQATNIYLLFFFPRFSCGN